MEEDAGPLFPEQEVEPRIPAHLEFVFAGLAGMTAACFVQPFEVVKSRMQVTGIGTTTKEFRNSAQVLWSLVRTEGIPSLFKGLSAAVLRQATFQTVRMGTYTWLDAVYARSHREPTPLLYSMAMGMTAGGCAAIFSTPAEVALIRMSVDGRLPPSKRRNYRNVFEALTRIGRQEGVDALWNGFVPTAIRSMAGSMTQLATYSHCKRLLAKRYGMADDVPLHMSASLAAGLLTAIVTMPFDMAKTRIQDQKPLADGKMEYTDTWNVMYKVGRHEGVMALWKGFTPFYMRLGSMTVLLFVFLEQLNGWYLRHIE